MRFLRDRYERAELEHVLSGPGIVNLSEFTHQGDLCTFEVLLRDFALDDSALAVLGGVVHDIDMKDAKFNRPETAGVEHLVAGIAWLHEDDDGRIAHAAAVFDALYAYFKRRKG